MALLPVAFCLRDYAYMHTVLFLLHTFTEYIHIHAYCVLQELWLWLWMQMFWILQRRTRRLSPVRHMLCAAFLSPSHFRAHCYCV